MFHRRWFLQASLLSLLAPRASRAGSGPLASRPYLQNMRGDRAVLRWVTLQPGDAEVRLTSATGDERSFPAVTTELTAGETGIGPRYHHQARLDRLDPAGVYSYQVRANGIPIGQDRLSFRTPDGQPFSFLAIGDTGTGSDEQAALAALMEKEPCQLVIHTGDLAYPSGFYEAYENRYFDYYHALMARVPFFPCPGNHDYYDTGAQPYFQLHSLPSDGVPPAEAGRYYSVEWGDAEFFSLDSNDTLEAAAAGRSPMLEWLDRGLKQSRKFWRIVFFHHTPFPLGQHIEDPLCILARERIVPILEANAVPLVLNGHEHAYQRSLPIGGTTYVTTGGGGAPLHEPLSTSRMAAAVPAFHYLRAAVEGRNLTISAPSLNGETLDRFSLAPSPVLQPSGIVNAASFTSQIGRGAFISIFGWHFCVDAISNGGQPLPPRAGGITVTVDGRAIPLLLASPGHLNAVLPAGLRGAVRLEVETPSGATAADVEILPVAPAIFPSALPASVRAGQSFALYVTGLAGFEGDLTVRIGAQSTPAALAAGDVPGLQLVWLTVPSSLPAGEHSLTLVAGDAPSNTVRLQVSA